MFDPKQHMRNAAPLGGGGAELISALGSLLGSGAQGAKKMIGIQDNPLVDIAIKKFEQNPSAPGMTPEEASAFLDAYGKMLFKIDPNNPEEYAEALEVMTR